MKIKCSYHELVDVVQLVVNPKNPNKHPEKQIKMLSKILDFQGQRIPILVSKRSGFIVAGHGRLEAIKALGWEKCAVDYQDFESEAQEYAHMIADNKISELAKHDDSMMIEELKDIDIDDFELLGMEDFELPIEIDPAQEEIEDEVPINVDTRTKPGDLWILGDHRLLCGDSTNIQHVERLMGGEKADMVFTDPPYGVSYEDSLGRSLKNDTLTDESLEEFVTDAFASGQSVSKDNIPWFVWHASRFQREFENALNKNGLTVKQQIIWTKGEGKEGTSEVSAPAIGRSHFRWLHEPCFYASTGSCYNAGDRKTTTVWTVSRPTTGTDHPTQKPIPLIEIALDNSSKQENVILDLFGGSGSTLIACEKTKRKCYTVELDPRYCDVILSRWEKYSGKEAKLDGQTE